MKNFLFVLCVTPGVVFGAQMTPPKIIAEQSMNVYFAPPVNQGQRYLRVYDNGNVETGFVSRRPEGKSYRKVIAKIAINPTKNLINLGKTIKSDNPELADPNKPKCMDAPTMTVSLLNANGKLAPIYKKMFCNDYNLKDENLQYEIRPALDLINGMEAVEALDQAN